MKDTFNANEIAAAISATPRAVRKRAAKDAWPVEQAVVRGGKQRLYPLATLPADIQIALTKKHRATQVVKRVPPPTSRAEVLESLWMRYERAPQSMKDEARRRVEALHLRQQLISNGVKRTEALQAVVETYAVNRATVLRWVQDVAGHDAQHWLALLTPRYTVGKGQTQVAACDEAAWEFFKADYLRLEQPTLSDCYRRLERAAGEYGWQVPTRRTLARWVVERIPAHMRVLLREGEYALMRRYPALERSVSELHALQWINGDGYQHNVFVKWPDGQIERPKTWFWQDIYSRKILAWRVDATENSDMIRLAFGDLVEQFGIPDHVTIDNTRAAANKWMTGGIANRYRFKVKEDDPMGLFRLLDIQVHWTSVLNGRGHGQAKPIERAFGVGGFGDAIDKHPAFAGAYTGADPTAKPENYGSTAVPLDRFVDVLQQEIIEWNARDGRRTEICDGKHSFNTVFNTSYIDAPIRRASAEQRRLWLLSAESITVRPDGTFTLKAGAKVGGGANRYYAPELHDLGDARARIVVRFDRYELHEHVYCYTADGRFVCQADILDAAGFGDTETARIHNRARKQWIRATKEAAKAEVRMDAIAVAGQLPAPEAEADAVSRVTRMALPAQRLDAPRQDPAMVERAREALGNIVAMPRQATELQALIERNDPCEMYLHWVGLQRRKNAGDALKEDEQSWFTTFPMSSYFEAGKQLATIRRLA